MIYLVIMKDTIKLYRPVCPICGKTKSVTHNSMYNRKKDKALVHVWRCTACDKSFVKPSEKLKKRWEII